jgi:NOL1/NOP2/fmu family ribosome biogenesis protein
MPGRPEWSGLSTHVDTLRGAVRLFPHRVSGEGHFACLLSRKNGPSDETTFPMRRLKIPPPEWKLWQAFREETLALDFPSERLRLHGDRLYFIPEEIPDMKGLRVTIPGIWLGNVKKERFEPAHPLAMLLRTGQAQNILSLTTDSREMAAYMRGESLPSEGIPGWTLVTADGWPLSWGKRVQGVVKNHFPRGWQINS